MRRPLRRVASGRGAWIVCALVSGACDPTGSAATVLEPGASDGVGRTRHDDHGALTAPTVDAVRRAIDTRHRLRAVVRSAAGVPAYDVRVEIWRHSARADEPELAATARTDLDGVALLPFDGRGVYCVHAVHPTVGVGASAPSTYRLFGSRTTVDATVALPPGDPPIERAGIAQVGVADTNGRPLAGADVFVWRHDFATDETALAASGCTDADGALRLVLDGPDWYAVVANHAEHGTSATDYAWFEPRSPYGERTRRDDEDRRPVRCDGHLRIGDPPSEPPASTAFRAFDLADDAPTRGAEPACCRAWTRPASKRSRGDRALSRTAGLPEASGARRDPEVPFLLRKIDER